MMMVNKIVCDNAIRMYVKSYFPSDETGTVEIATYYKMGGIYRAFATSDEAVEEYEQFIAEVMINSEDEGFTAVCFGH